jgi:predicted membrane-bound mannosyltransferase
MVYAPLFQQLMSSGSKAMKEIIRKHIEPRSQAVEKLLARGVRNGEFRKTSELHSAVSLAALVVFYFTSAPVLELLGHTDAYNKANLDRRKQEVLDFVRYGLFADPKAPLP